MLLPDETRVNNVAVVEVHISLTVTQQRQTLNYWMIPTLFNSITTSCLEESAPA